MDTRLRRVLWMMWMIGSLLWIAFASTTFGEEIRGISSVDSTPPLRGIQQCSQLLDTEAARSCGVTVLNARARFENKARADAYRSLRAGGLIVGPPFVALLAGAGALWGLGRLSERTPKHVPAPTPRR